jgi:adenosylmethionine-8-amino-7-oxononanoate aminotransferase
MTVAKGLGGGYIPLGATLYSDAIGQVIAKADGAVNTGHTFTGHTLACAAAAAVQEIIIRDRLVKQVRSQGEKLRELVKQHLAHLEAVGDIRGRGYFLGVELVSNRDSKQAFDPALKLTEVIRRRTLEAGLICYPVSGTIDGVSGDVVIIAPPYNASSGELEEIADKLANGLRLALAEIQAA